MGDSSQTTRRVADSGTEAATDNTHDAIQIIEAFLNGVNPPLRARDTWKHVKDAALQGTRAELTRRATDASRDKSVTEIKAQLSDLKETVQRLIEKPQGQPTFAEIARNAAKAKDPGLDRAKPVLARRSRELIIALSNETMVQRQRAGKELVQEMNSAIGKEDVVAARRLPSGDVLATFQGHQEKEKWESKREILRAFGEDARIKISSVVSSVAVLNTTTVIPYHTF